jgi:hypothetical protein
VARARRADVEVAGGAPVRAGVLALLDELEVVAVLGDGEGGGEGEARVPREAGRAMRVVQMAQVHHTAEPGDGPESANEVRAPVPKLEVASANTNAAMSPTARAPASDTFEGIQVTSCSFPRAVADDSASQSTGSTQVRRVMGASTRTPASPAWRFPPLHVFIRRRSARSRTSRV